MAVVKYYTWTWWDKSAVACLGCLYHFGLFLYFVIAMSGEEDADRCTKKTLNLISVCTGLRLAWCIFEQTKFWLVICKQIKPNQFAIIDYLLFLGEAGWSIYVFTIFAYELKRDCKGENYAEFCVLAVCFINAIIMVLKCFIHTVCYIGYIILLFTKLIKFERCGEAASFLAFALWKPEPTEVGYQEANKIDPKDEKDISKGPLRKSERSYKEEDVDRLRSIKEESKKSH